MKNLDEVVVDKAQNLELIIFSVANRLVAIEMASLIEIVEALPVSPLPFVPAYVDGLINVNGKILPQVNLATLMFNNASTEVVDSTVISGFEDTLLIINVSEFYLALKISLVKESVTIEKQSILSLSSSQENVKATEKSQASPYLLGTFNYNLQEILLFDVNALKDVVRASDQPSGKTSFLGKVTKSKSQVEVFNEYLIAQVGDKEYAFELNDVAEIVILDVIHAQPRAPKLIAGIGIVRGQPRLVVNLAELLGFEVIEKVTAIAVIMVRFGDIYCGVLADKMVGLETIQQGQTKQTNSKKNKPILREDGHTLTQVIQFADIFTETVLTQIRPYMPEFKNEMEQIEIIQQEMLRFELGGDAYAFNLNDIRRVVSGKIIEPLLSEFAFIIGTMELEGKVIPVINLVNQLGYDEVDKNLIEYIVVNDGHSDWALAIGLSDQIVKIDENKIDSVKTKHVKYVSAFSTYNDKLLTILNIRAICKENQHATVD